MDINIKNICNTKNQINDLLQDIFTEYNRMNDCRIMATVDSHKEMKHMSENINSLEYSNKEKENEIRLLKKTNHEYGIMINDLQSKFEIAEEDRQEDNKFDMLRIQAKEISEKGREIDRLNGLLNHFKNKDTKIDKILKSVTSPKSQDIEVDVKVDDVKVDDVNLETGEENPNFIYPNECPPSPGGSDDGLDISVEDKSVEDKSVENKSVEDLSVEDKSVENKSVEDKLVDDKSVDDKSVDDKSVEDKLVENKLVEDKLVEDKSVEDKSSLDKGKLLKVTSKGVKYFAHENENPQQLYEFNDDKLCEKIVGTRTKNEKGKYKVQLFDLKS